MLVRPTGARLPAALYEIMTDMGEPSDPVGADARGDLGAERTRLSVKVCVRRLTKLVLVLSAAMVAAVSAGVAVTWLWWLDDPAASQRSRGLNALWAAHTWVGDDHTDTQYRDFAALLRRSEISDVFFHAGPFEADGSVRPERYRRAETLVRAMRELAPEIRSQAYLGQVERRGGGPLDLRDVSVRRRIVATAEAFLDLGFAGIHYDIEPIYPDDEHFLELLTTTHRLTRARGAVLSVAVEQLEVVPGAQQVLGPLGYHHPTRGFLEEVAERVDQVAIMTYDTGLPADWLFGLHMAWQTQHVVELIGDDVTVFMGVPTYGKGRFPGFHSWAENVRSGVRGVRKGLDRLSAEQTGHVGRPLRRVDYVARRVERLPSGLDWRVGTLLPAWQLRVNAPPARPYRRPRRWSFSSAGSRPTLFAQRSMSVLRQTRPAAITTSGSGNASVSASCMTRWRVTPSSSAISVKPTR